jgi:RNA polymerase subunit RPABC4/transcription elongation factor Spt4
MADERKEVFLSCFKCGRIVRASDSDCPRCGLQFGPGTLFECPFCSGLVWRNATKCSTCGIDLTEFSQGVEKASSGFDMDEFVDNIIKTEMDKMKSLLRRVACPGCGLMIRGDEDKCPRCDLPLVEARVECPVCGEKISISAKSCGTCGAIFEDLTSDAAKAMSLGRAAEEEPSEEAGPSKQAPGPKPAGAKKPSFRKRKLLKKAKPKKTK